MRVLIDTNIVLDHLLSRKPHDVAAGNLFAMVEQKEIIGFLCATTVTTIDYLVSKSLNKSVSKEIIGVLLQLFEISPVNKQILQDASISGFSDFEDAVLYCSALSCDVKAIITRNPKDFAKSQLPLFNAKDFIVQF